METLQAGPLEFHDKIPLKTGYKEKEFEVVPHAVARHGAYISRDDSDAELRQYRCLCRQGHYG